MATFAYRAADRRGQTVAGVLEAPDMRAAVEQLQRDTYYPIEVTPRDSAGGHARGGALAGLSALGSRRVSGRDLVGFTQRLATLLEAGLPLDRALAIQAELAPTARLRAIATGVLEDVRGGTALADALAKHHPHPFSRLYVNMVRAGERGGVLEVTLRRLAEFLEEAQALRDTLVSALIYPALLTLVGTAAVVFLMTFVIPRFADIFRDLGGAIPPPTRLLLAVSGWLQHFWWVLGLGGLGAALAARVVLSTPAGRLAVDRLAVELPVIRHVLLDYEMARLSRTLGTLLGSGVALVGALGLVKETSSNRYVARAVGSLGEGVKRGAGLARPMAEAKVFPALAIHMVRVGEETGRLDEMLLKVAATFDADTRRRLKRLIALAEPAIILVMGLVVGFIVVAMLLAIFSISEIPL
ncbi:MAG TPA: type II secretion system F family protein [Methylomirabilota bacterium]|nr:type II secretion system F family protein [Methylomirabilota bacterium]